MGLLEAWGASHIVILGQVLFPCLSEELWPLNVSAPHQSDYIPGPSVVSVAGGPYQDQKPGVPLLTEHKYWSVML